MDALLTLDGLVALLTLAALEIVLGVDNLVFISIVTGRLPAAQQPLARKLGLGPGPGLPPGPALHDLVDDGAHPAAVPHPLRQRHLRA